MSNKNKIPKRIELGFDAVYLLLAFALGATLAFGPGTLERRLWGAMALTLAFGDAFHLVPRMAAALTGTPQRFAHAMGIGKCITSITMSLFYLLLWWIGLRLFGIAARFASVLFLLFTAARILLCLLPQNEWTSPSPSVAWGICRNLPFVAQGLMVAALYAGFGTQVLSVRWLWLAVLISFGCYLPVVLWVHKSPKLGMLMLPKTCAYLWILTMGFGLSVV